MHIRTILLLAVLAVFGGCTTMTPQERSASDEKTCLSYGFRRNTDAIATCMQRIDLDRRADARSLRDRNDVMMWGWNRPVVVR